jgi:hypothetical protein
MNSEIKKCLGVFATTLVLSLTACGEDKAAQETAELVRVAEERGFYVVSALDRHDYAIVSFGGCEGVLEFDDRGVVILSNINDWDGPEDWERFTIPDARADEVLELNRFEHCN